MKLSHFFYRVFTGRPPFQPQVAIFTRQWRPDDRLLVHSAERPAYVFRFRKQDRGDR